MSFFVQGIPENTPASAKGVFVSRIEFAYQEFVKSSHQTPLISFGERNASTTEVVEQALLDTGNKSSLFAQKPLYSFSQLILPDTTKKTLFDFVQAFKVKDIVFNKWGMSAIEPNPKIALNFFGSPGTGKTLAAHAIANYLEKKIIIASYAEIESQYHGVGPKNVKAIFQKAQQEDAVLFIDEADSLLSKRLTNVSQGSEQAINSMRSQLLICLEQFSGIVLFATNLIQNYDKAFETRIQHIEFPLPDFSCRKAIWQQMLVPSLPCDESVNIDSLAEIDDVCGRDIRNAIIQAAISAALHSTKVSLALINAKIDQIKSSRIANVSTTSQKETLNSSEDERLSAAIKKAFDSKL